MVRDLFAAALARIVHGLELRTRNLPAGAYLPKTFTSVVTLPGTAGQTVVTPDFDLRNSGRFPFVAEELHLFEDVASPTAWRFEVQDRDTQQVILGAPDRIDYRASALDVNSDGFVQPTGLLRFTDYEWTTKGGIRVTCESAGTANTVYIAIRGYWRLPDEVGRACTLPGLPPVRADRPDPRDLSTDPYASARDLRDRLR